MVYKYTDLRTENWNFQDEHFVWSDQGERRGKNLFATEPSERVRITAHQLETLINGLDELNNDVLDGKIQYAVSYGAHPQMLFSSLKDRSRLHCAAFVARLVEKIGFQLDWFYKLDSKLSDVWGSGRPLSLSKIEESRSCGCGRLGEE